MKYLGPKIKKMKLKPFCKDFFPKNGFIKVEFKDIIDGDTAYFLINGFVESVRFMVVDTPSIYPNIQEYGIEARDFTLNILKNGKEIYLESDKYNNLYDDTLNKRLLAWVWVDGKLLNYLLVQNGYASNKYVIHHKMKYLKYLDDAFEYAKNNKLGIHK